MRPLIFFIITIFSFPIMGQNTEGSLLFSLLNQERNNHGLSYMGVDSVAENSLTNHLNWADPYIQNNIIDQIPTVELFHIDHNHNTNQLITGFTPRHRYYTEIDTNLKQYILTEESGGYISEDVKEMFSPFVDTNNIWLLPSGYPVMENEVMNYALDNEVVLVWEFYVHGNDVEALDQLLANEEFKRLLFTNEEYHNLRMGYITRIINGKVFHAVAMVVSLGEI